MTTSLDLLQSIDRSERLVTKIDNTKLVDQQALDMMPSGNIINYVFEGKKDLRFVNRSKDWILQDTLISGATAMGDLDNDGDMDIVTNNINHSATLYINKTDKKANYLKVKLKSSGKNPFAIGAKILSYHKGILQYKEMYTVRGFQSSSEPMIHFGYGKESKIDSLRIIWPDRTTQLLKDVAANQTLVIKPENTTPITYPLFTKAKKEIFKRVEGNLGIDFVHKEDAYFDFNRQKLIPYEFSDRGPAVAVGDLDNDGSQDIFFGGSKFTPSKIYTQHSEGFREKSIIEIKKDSIKEDIEALIEDFNGDGKKDLFIGSGGADFFNQMLPLSDSYYVQKDSTFILGKLTPTFQNASVLASADFDSDGDIDLFVGNQMITNDFGKIPQSYLLENKNGSFELVENKSLLSIGMVTDAIWDDYNGDGSLDLIIVGEWMNPVFFKNKGGTLEKDDFNLSSIKGLWQSIISFDIDNDGDKDYLLGNWGLNSKFKASHRTPMKMYYADFDDNGSTETIVTIEKNGQDYPIEGLKGLSEQLVSLRKKFTAYKDFAGKPIEGILSKEELEKATIFEVSELSSGYLENKDGKFNFIPFPVDLQVAPIMTFLKYDFDSDGTEEVLAAGNYFGVKPYHGRLGSFSGAMIKDKNNVILGNEIGLDFSQKSIRHLNIINFNNRPYLIATFNNEPVQVYQMINKIDK